MTHAFTDLRALARSHTEAAIDVLFGIMQSEEATPAARVSAALAILDRGWGKAGAQSDSGEDAARHPVHRIERFIVDPDHAER